VQYSSNYLALSEANAVPYLTAAEAGNLGGDYGPWISVGCNTHNETPPLDDEDGQPNWGWLNGALDDVRIYNRALAAGEIALLYSGEVAPASGRMNVRTLRAKTITVRN
jgi:hypothetical protein